MSGGSKSRTVSTAPSAYTGASLMSGDSKSKPKTTTPAAITQPMQTVQPGMPGQIDALSQQLAAGFGQQPNDIMTQLMQYYQPMSLPNYAPPAPVTPAPTPPTTPTPTPTPPAAKPIIKKPAYGYSDERRGGVNR